MKTNTLKSHQLQKSQRKEDQSEHSAEQSTKNSQKQKLVSDNDKNILKGNVHSWDKLTLNCLK